VGRARELSLLLDGIDSDIVSRIPGVTSISGPAGAGKTRLVLEAASGSEAAFLFVEASGTPGVDPFEDFVRSWFGTRGGIGPDGETRDGVIFDRLWEGLLLRLELEGGRLGGLRDELRRTKPFLRCIVAGAACPGPQDPQVLATGRRSAVCAFVAALSACGPVAVILEDLQEFPHESLDTLLELQHAVAGQRASFTATSRTRPDGSAFPFPAASVIGRTATIELDGLPRESLSGFVGGLTGLVPSEEAAGLLWTASGGIPLLLEHVVLHALETGAMVGEGGWLRPSGASVALPAGADLLFEARLEHLPDPLPLLVRGAAVLGGSIDTGTLARLTGLDPSPLLREPVDRRLLAWSDGEVAFTHELVREAALRICPPAEAARLHMAAARLLEPVDPQASPGFLERIGTHYLLGGDHAAAAPLLLKAAEGCAALYDNDQAQSLYQRAAILLMDPARTETELALAEVQRSAGLMNRTVDLLTATRERIARDPRVDGRLRARVAASLGGSLAAVGRVEVAEVVLGEALATFREIRDLDGTATTLRYLGTAALSAGRTGEALGLLEESLDLSRELGDPASVCSSLYWLGIACRETGNPARLRSLTEEQVVLARGSGLVRSLIGALDNLMRVHIYETDFDSAEVVHEELRAAAEASGNWAALSTASSKLGIIHLKRGRWAKAEECFARCVVLTERTGNMRARCAALGNLAHAAIELEKLDEAMRHAMSMIESASSIGFRLGVLSGYARVACILDLRGAWDAALDCLQTQMEHAEALGDTRNLSDAHAMKARILNALDRQAEALEAVDRALVLSELAGDQRLRSGQLELKGKLQVLLGRPEEAVRTLEEVLGLVSGEEGREKVVYYAGLYLEAALADLGDPDAPARLLAKSGEAFDDSSRAELFFQHWRLTGSQGSASEARRLMELEHARKPQPLLASRLAQLR